ncbi:hypothetical protein FNV43_RR17332 [Rhamnella rubrinervis]|uniref:Pentatricopeptide repeat-containing protein n=1 Tax=Rhamnella rubrinervis TaxID=2594499 RepID=A0A8K0E969_9ROSA|nr:hypothetical protein FNV43_RR17332 [Rhamnella rubrinervis]
MSSSVSIRHLRRLSTTASTTSATKSSSISISKAKSKLRSEYDPDKALEIYSSVSKHYCSPTSSRYAQDLTVRRLAKSRRFTDIETLVESHKSDPKIKEEPYLSTLIRSYGLAGMFDHAMRTYEQMDDLGTPRSVISFNTLLSACNHSKMFDKVPVLFNDIPKKYGVSPNKITYGILAKAYCEAGSPEKAIETLREMEDKGVEITAVTFTTIFDALYKKGRSEEAEQLWNKMEKKGCELDVAAYNVRIMHSQGGKPEKNGMMDEARKVYEGLEEHECNPNAATFRTFIYYLCRNGDYERGYKVFKTSVHMHRIPDFNTMKHLVEGLVKTKKTKEAKGLIRTIKKKFPPNVLNSWKKIEEDLGLASASDASLTPEDEDEEAAA